MSISGTIAKTVSNYESERSVGSSFRAKRIAPLMGMIESVFQAHGHVDIIDLGGTESYWNIVPRRYLDDHNVTITIVNLPGRVTGEDHGPFRFIGMDACSLRGIEDNTFHIAHSNSVIEHVGDWARMVQFASEISRVAEQYFVQTPNYWFPIEPHCMTPFFHWLPKPFRVWLVSHFQLGHWRKAMSVNEAMHTVEGSRMLSKKMLQALFEDATIATERLFLLPKSFTAIKK